jgi:hypothetical protein
LTHFKETAMTHFLCRFNLIVGVGLVAPRRVFDPPSENSS